MYLVVVATTIRELELKVSEHLKDGFLLSGGITTQIYYNSEINYTSNRTVIPGSYSGYTIHYLQAIYKPQPKDLL